MSTTILSGDFTVYFTDDTGGDKQIRWTGGTNPARHVNELYSNLNDLFDNVSAGAGLYMDEGTPMSAQTPTAYTIGEIETNDNEAWFIDPATIQKLYGGAITTTGWTRDLPGDGTGEIGIVKFDYTVGAGTDFASGDLGLTVSSTANGCSGTLLYFESDGSNGTAWVRPDSNTAADDWDNSPAATDIAASTGTGTGLSQDAAATTGENLWSNLFTLGTLVDDTRVYVTQSNTEISNWWGEGNLDILVLVQDQDTLIDNGIVTVYARQYSTTYDYIEVDLSGGGRTPAPLSTGLDRINNGSGIRSVTVSGASSAFSTGELVTGGTSTAKGVVLENTGSPTTSFTYYLVGDTTVDFTNTETLTGDIVGSNGTAGTPSSTGPATYSDVTFTFGHNATFDINNDTTNEDYSIVINCNSRPLTEVYERCKYITRRGETTSLNGIEGQQYIGIDYRLVYNTLTGSITTGSTVTQVTSGATSVVVAHDTTNKVLMLRDTFGTYNTTNNVEIDGSNFVTMTGGSTEIITPLKTSPFGSFAGGRFFGARGVVLDNVPTADKNNYEVLDNAGNLVVEPIQVNFTLTNLRTDSEVRIFDNSATNFFLDKEITGTEGSTSQLDSVLIANGGTGYSVSDVLTISGGTITVDEGFERSIGGVTYAYRWRVSGNSASLANVYQFIQHQLRQSTDIDFGAGTARGDITDLLMSFATPTGTTLDMIIDNLDSNDINNATFQDHSETNRNYPFTASGNLVFNSNLQGDTNAKYWLYFSNDDAGTNLGRDYGTKDAIIVKDFNDVDITGNVNGAGTHTGVAGSVDAANNVSIPFTFAYDTNVQRGAGSAATVAPVTLVAIGLSNAQFVISTGSITRTTGITLSAVAALERNYSNP